MSKHNFNLENYDVNNPLSWFNKAEIIFNSENVPENTKYQVLVKAIFPIINLLPKYILEKILPITSTGLQPGNYKKLKNALCSENPQKLDLTNKKVNTAIIALGEGKISARNIKIDPNKNNDADISNAIIADIKASISATEDIFIGNKKVHSNSAEEEATNQNNEKMDQL